jgi:hypothetical protein
LFTTVALCVLAYGTWDAAAVDCIGTGDWWSCTVVDRSLRWAVAPLSVLVLASGMATVVSFRRFLTIRGE